MTTILTKKKDTSGAPAPGDLTNAAGGAELAVNTADKRLYTKDSGGNVVEIGTNPTILNIDNIQIDGNTISSTNSNGNIIIAPNGTGDVQLDADTIRIGDSNTAALITTNGTGDITINTNGGTNSGSIAIANGVNGSINIYPNGTGGINLGSSSSNGLVVNALIKSTLSFFDGTYDIGGSFTSNRPSNGFFTGIVNSGLAASLPYQFFALDSTGFAAGGVSDGIYTSAIKLGTFQGFGFDTRYFNAGSWRSSRSTATVVDGYQGTFRVFTNSGLTAGVDYSPSLRFSIDSTGLIRSLGGNLVDPSIVPNLTIANASDSAAYGGVIGQRFISADTRQGLFVQGTGSLTLVSLYNTDFLAGQTTVPLAANTGLAMRINANGTIVMGGGTANTYPLEIFKSVSTAGVATQLNLYTSGSADVKGRVQFDSTNGVSAAIEGHVTGASSGSLVLYSSRGAGAGLIRAYAVDSAGNQSWTNSTSNTSGTDMSFIAGNLTVGNGESAASSATRLNTGVTAAGTAVTLAEFRNRDFTASTRSFVRVMNFLNSVSAYVSYFGTAADGKTYLYSNDPSRNGDIVIDPSNGFVGINNNVPGSYQPLTVSRGVSDNSLASIIGVRYNNAGFEAGVLGYRAISANARQGLYISTSAGLSYNSTYNHMWHIGGITPSNDTNLVMQLDYTTGNLELRGQSSTFQIQKHLASMTSVNNGGGSGIAATINGLPTFTLISAQGVTGTSDEGKWMLAICYKQSNSAGVSQVVLANGGLGIQATNTGGTVALNGFNDTNNIRMSAQKWNALNAA